MNDDLVFLDSVLLQQDMRIRLPKSLLVNINGVPGTTRLEIYFNATTKDIIIRDPSLHESQKDNEYK